MREKQGKMQSVVGLSDIFVKQYLYNDTSIVAHVLSPPMQKYHSKVVQQRGIL